MSGLLDASVLVRYLTKDPPRQALVAREIIEDTLGLLVSTVMLAETAHVLTSVYKVDRAAVIDALLAVLQRENLQPLGLDKALVVQALLKARPSGGVSVADALLWAEAKSTGNAVYSFDLRFPGEGIAVRRTPG